MAVTSSLSLLDPEIFRPGVFVIDDPQALNLIETLNYLYRYHRQSAWVSFFREGEGVDQGASSDIDTTADGATYVVRLEAFYRARASSTNNNLFTLITVAEATTADGIIRCQVTTSGGSVIDTVSNTHTAGSTTLVSTTVSGGALDPNTDYYLSIASRAGNTGRLRLFAIACIEAAYAADNVLP